MKRLYIPLMILLATTCALAVQVDVEELKSGKKIDFQNYVPPGVRPDSFTEIRAIGYGLAAGTARWGENVQVPYHLKYSIIRATSKEEPDKLSADIFSIDPDAKVTHIDNLRLIIAAYLEGMYAYSAKDAWTLAVFATYYNAVYRGKLDYFAGKYKLAVTKHLAAWNAGLSVKFSEWPGQTKLLIPLTENASRGTIGTIDADIISDDKVKEFVRKDDTKIDERKDLVDIKKKVIDEEKKKLDEEKKKLEDTEKKNREEKDRIDKEKKEIEKEKKAEETERKKIEEEKKKVPAITDEKEREKKKTEIEEREKELKKQTEDTKKEEKKIAEEEKKRKENEDTAKKEAERVAEKEKKIADREKKLEEEKKEIREDEKKKDPGKKPDETVVKKEEKEKEKAKELEKKEKELDRREDALRDKEPDKSIYALKLYYLKIKEYLEEGHYNNEMIMINASTRRVEFQSPVKNICGSRYDIFSEGIAVIAHAGSHKGEHRLVLLDRDTLAAKATGADDIFWRSFVEIREGNIYAVMIEKNECYLGKYDGTLKRVARSAEKVNKETFISFFQDFIYINRHDRKILVLKKSDLSVVDTIDPAALPVK